MARAVPSIPGGGGHPRQTERDSYGGERRWEVGAGETWSAPRPGAYEPRDRLTDPASARWHGGDDRPDERGVIERIGDALGMRSRGPKNYQRSDERIREDLCERLWHEPRVDVEDVSVTVSGGVVHLEGTVPDRKMKHIIEDTAAACRGVTDVENRIRVSPDAQRAPHSGLY
jgi:hypothetical protein